jgi:hypothetical protein
MIPITTYTFESILNYLILQKSTNARFVRNIVRLMDSLDRKAYEKDDYIITALNAITDVARLRHDGISNTMYIKNYLLQGPYDQKHISHIYQTFEPLGKNEYDNLGKIVRDYVDYTYLYQSRNDIMSAYDELMNAHGKMATDTIDHLKDILENLVSVMRRANVMRESNEAVSVSAKPTKELKSELGKLYDNLTDPANIFKTGLKELNRFLNGGLRRKGMVIIYGPTNSFKSGALLYFALWIIQFNPGLKPKTPGKKLGIVIVTMENTRDEELERIHAIYTQGMVNVKDITREVWMEQWEQIFSSLGTDIELHIIYKSPIDTTTLDIQASVEELEEDNNLEIMAVIIDHLGNIKSRNRSSNINEWRETVQIAYELSDWGKSSNRAILTAMHTNSEIDRQLADAIQAGKTNLVKMLGRHCIADAKYIDRAVDLSLYIYLEYNNIDGQWYLGWKFEKQRGKRDRGSNIFYHRLDNGITLQYDEGTPVCKSFPCIPGTENTIQSQQIALYSNGGQPRAASGFGQNPFQQGFTNPFNNKTVLGDTVRQNAPPAAILNAHPNTDYGIDTAISSPITDSEYAQSESIDEINNADFKDDSDDIEKMVNYAAEYDSIGVPLAFIPPDQDIDITESDFMPDTDEDYGEINEGDNNE